MRAVEIGSRAEAGSSRSRNLGLYGYRPRNAQPLLLASGKTVAAPVKDVFYFIPQRRLAKRPFHPLSHAAFIEAFVELYAEGYVVVDGHGERRRLLKNHAHPGSQLVEIVALLQYVNVVHR